MVLVDTSVWVEFLRRGHTRLATLLAEVQVMTHPIIVGELACGNIKNRHNFLSLLTNLPHATELTHAEVLQFIKQHRLMGRGVGFFDLHLLGSTLVSKVKLWTLDKRLSALAAQFRVRLLH